MQSLLNSAHNRVASMSAESFAAWSARGSQHCTTLDELNWHLGDWFLDGRERFPDRYGAEALKLLDNREEWRKWAYVCSCVPPEVRRKELSFWFHYEVAPLNHLDQRNFLALAVQKRWRREDLREAVRLHQGYTSEKVNAPVESAAVFQEALSDLRLKWRRLFSERPVEKWSHDERLRLKLQLSWFVAEYNRL